MQSVFNISKDCLGVSLSALLQSNKPSCDDCVGGVYLVHLLLIGHEAAGGL